MPNTVNTRVYAGRIKEKKIVMKSSSGGAFTAISDYFIERGDAVIAAVYEYDNYNLNYKIIQSKSDRDKAIGSKYMQSRMGNIYNEAYYWLKQNVDKKILFVGMGCQADGFRKFCEMKKIRDRVYIVDIVCHGMPSAKLWKEYAEYIENKYKGKIKYLTFKDKRNGWKNPSALVEIEGKEIMIKDYVNVFYSGCALRPYCYKCKYATIVRKTDLTIGDFWHIEETIPEFFEPEGTSLFLIHTEYGVELFNNIKQCLFYKKSDIKQCWQYNLERPTEKPKGREKFWNDYRRGGIFLIIKKYGLNSLFAKIQENRKVAKNRYEKKNNII